MMIDRICGYHEFREVLAINLPVLRLLRIHISIAEMASQFSLSLLEKNKTCRFKKEQKNCLLNMIDFKATFPLVEEEDKLYQPKMLIFVTRHTQ